MYRQQHVSGIDPEQQYQISANSSSLNYAPFPGSTAGIADTAFQSGQHHLSPPMRSGPSRQTIHSRQPSNEWQPSNSLSPHPNRSNQGGDSTAPFKPIDRALPSRDVSAETITDAYTAFVLYCNPSFGPDVDTTTLRENFQSPPKSDSKDFEVYRLFELIRKFDAKEIKTWGQLALDLGVEPPDVSKGQSVQKVQQYSVRLKRWMRAMHVDAFFEYLLGKQHAYSQDIPPPNDPHPANGRDGVIAEEDLAIRALDPSLRPKRGRRRNSDTEHDEVVETAAGDILHSAHPAAVNPFDGNDPWAIASAVAPQNFAPWFQKENVPQSAIASSAPSHMRWQLHGNPYNPATPHPMTALPSSMAAHIEAAFDNEPKSAITPSSRKRRKHGPAVSSAWPSANAPGSKPRGRPPASRNVQDGPFSIFPADPANDKEASNVSTLSAPITLMEKQPREPDRSTGMPSLPSEANGRPARLSLQVPQHTGGPVRLATPPRVMVNGERSESEPALITTEQQINTPSINQRAVPSANREIPGFAFEVLKRVVASDLLRAQLVGRRQRLSGDEAKRLADAVLERLNVPRADTENSRDDIARLTAASWLGVGGQLNVPLGPANGQGKKITVMRLRVDADGYEEIVSAHDQGSGAIRELFDLSWTATMAGCTGTFELKGLSLDHPPPDDQDVHDTILDAWHDVARRVGIDEDRILTAMQNFQDEHNSSRGAMINTATDDGVDWKSKYRVLEFGSRMAKGEFERFRQLLIERVLDTII
ncbi:hypothetical protein LTR37_019551 [Vermiconidia calcicola]|uniref:Uncharacterized protein n=1 Tax=Vermiconidia calcicola TaxID=1690605 RepID=A0ACC3MGW4_9PEZI|nr:hypothetical protein LTR37_019551 [Vermiconidia calcicola]